MVHLSQDRVPWPFRPKPHDPSDIPDCRAFCLSGPRSPVGRVPAASPPCRRFPGSRSMPRTGSCGGVAVLPPPCSWCTAQAAGLGMGRSIGRIGRAQGSSLPAPPTSRGRHGIQVTTLCGQANVEGGHCRCRPPPPLCRHRLTEPTTKALCKSPPPMGDMGKAQIRLPQCSPSPVAQMAPASQHRGAPTPPPPPPDTLYVESCWRNHVWRTCSLPQVALPGPSVILWTFLRRYLQIHAHSTQADH